MSDITTISQPIGDTSGLRVVQYNNAVAIETFNDAGRKEYIHIKSDEMEAFAAIFQQYVDDGVEDDDCTIAKSSWQIGLSGDDNKSKIADINATGRATATDLETIENALQDKRYDISYSLQNGEMGVWRRE